MALVRLKRNWFGPGGVRYRQRDGLVEIPDDQIPFVPSDAEVFDNGGKPLPSRSLQPLPGFGAKPLHEQNLDLIPHAAPLHIEKTATSASTAAPALDAKEEEQRQKDAEGAVDVLHRANGSVEAPKEKHKEEQAAITEGIALATELQAKQDEANDPVTAAAAMKGNTPTPSSKADNKK